MAKSDKTEVPLGVHETLELHEIVTLRKASLMKAHVLESLVDDPKLRSLLRKEKQISEKAIEEIEALLP
ncbi:spore coat protein CotF [Salinicoccus jeotgali]|uniref:Spore coat protein CotF n=1 Tax=Salinicoccus jeotgali TaxID=381634 RepID=A0ABP7F1Z2_9STAP